MQHVTCHNDFTTAAAHPNCRVFLQGFCDIAIGCVFNIEQLIIPHFCRYLMTLLRYACKNFFKF